MKRFFVFFTVIAIIFSSCASLPILDRGSLNPENKPENELATLEFHKFTNIVTVDNNEVLWFTPRNKMQGQSVLLAPGVHTFTVRFHNGSVYSIGDQTVVANLAAGEKYVMKGIINDNRIHYEINNVNDGSNAALDMKKLAGSDSGVISSYIKYVLNPTMEKNDHMVKLENDDVVLLFKPDMLFSWTDKKTGKITEGYRGFMMNFTITEGTNYLLETDVSKMTGDQFLKDSNYEKTAQTVLVPVACSEKTVTVRYEKPDAMKGKEIIFTITEIK